MDLYQKKSMCQDAINKLNMVNIKNQELLTELATLNRLSIETLIVDNVPYQADGINFAIDNTTSTINEISNSIIPNLNNEINSLNQSIAASMITPTTVNTTQSVKPTPVSHSNY